MKIMTKQERFEYVFLCLFTLILGFLGGVIFGYIAVIPVFFIAFFLVYLWNVARGPASRR